MLAALFLAALSSSASSGHDDPDLVTLKDKKQVECRVLLENEQKVVYRTGKKTQEVARAEVTDVQSVERSLEQFLERFANADATSVPALADLALFAEKSYLPGEAFNTWIRILTLDPENEQAWTKLGGTKRRKGWELKVRGRFLDIQELRTRVSDWKNALELRTAHFLVQTDAAPELALDATLDLERAYLTFYKILGKPLELYVFDELPEIQIFADAKDFPAPPTPGRSAWFSFPANTLYVNVAGKPNRGDIVAELVDALIYNSFRRTLDKKTGQIEPWAREGLRQAFAGAVRPNPGKVRFDFETPLTAHFKTQASDAKALTLEQVLRAGFASFDSGTDAPRYVAQSYTLTHFLAFAGQGKYRAAYATFLKDSYLGKGGASNFAKAVGVDPKTLEAEWVAYVKKLAGG
ncbi:MAG: hypothetical protein EXS08_10860 [Planctomycetes bacterium]|nr:hypothetical protein [Planctomycetota bacterium]